MPWSRSLRARSPPSRSPSRSRSPSPRSLWDTDPFVDIGTVAEPAIDFVETPFTIAKRNARPPPSSSSSSPLVTAPPASSPPSSPPTVATTRTKLEAFRNPATARAATPPRKLVHDGPPHAPTPVRCRSRSPSFRPLQSSSTYFTLPLAASSQPARPVESDLTRGGSLSRRGGHRSIGFVPTESLEAFHTRKGIDVVRFIGRRDRDDVTETETLAGTARRGAEDPGDEGEDRSTPFFGPGGFLAQGGGGGGAGIEHIVLGARVRSVKKKRRLLPHAAATSSSSSSSSERASWRRAPNGEEDDDEEREDGETPEARLRRLYRSLD
ncbi:hypothetical protein JCM11491_001610 [Sporobolomyces phaffii]